MRQRMRGRDGTNLDDEGEQRIAVGCWVSARGCFVGCARYCGRFNIPADGTCSKFKFKDTLLLRIYWMLVVRRWQNRLWVFRAQSGWRENLPFVDRLGKYNSSKQHVSQYMWSRRALSDDSSLRFVFYFRIKETRIDNSISNGTMLDIGSNCFAYRESFL